MERITKSASETKRLGEDFAKRIIKKEYKKRRKKAFVICLKGDLGGGKTTFVQGFAKGLGIEGKVLSPTFVIMKKFSIPCIREKESFYRYLYHIDCYRIDSSKEVNSLGLKEIVSDPQNIVIIEWVDRIKEEWLSCALSIQFYFIDEKTRRVIIKENGKTKNLSCY